MKKKQLDIVILVLIVGTIVFMLLPKGVGLKFLARNEFGEKIHTYNFSSYFSMLPFGYAVFSPLLTAISTSILLLLTSINLVFKRCITYGWLVVISLVATFFSILSLSFDPNLFTTISLIIMILSTMTTILLSYQFYMNYREKRINH